MDRRYFAQTSVVYKGCRLAAGRVPTLIRTTSGRTADTEAKVDPA
jgi:hypothetical protein